MEPKKRTLFRLTTGDSKKGARKRNPVVDASRITVAAELGSDKVLQWICSLVTLLFIWYYLKQSVLLFHSFDPSLFVGIWKKTILLSLISSYRSWNHGFQKQKGLAGEDEQRKPLMSTSGDKKVVSDTTPMHRNAGSSRATSTDIHDGHYSERTPLVI